MKDDNDAVVAELHTELQRTGHVIVFAESCTAGMIAATLGRIPGISEWLAGSAVVYQLATKTEWLGVDSSLLNDPGPVSKIVSEQMATGVLSKTPHATIAASVTGHLGPNAPSDLDGVAWSTIALRTADGAALLSRKLLLDEATEVEVRPGVDDVTRRHQRQCEAVRMVLQLCVDTLRSTGPA